MKKIMMTIAAVSILGTAAPAFAQARGQNLDNRIENLQSQIQQGVQRGTISRNEAQPLRERLRQLTRLERQYSRGGFSRSEQNDLQRRIQTLRQQIQYASRDGRYDRNTRDGRDDHRGYEGRDDHRGQPRHLVRGTPWPGFGGRLRALSLSLQTCSGRSVAPLGELAWHFRSE